MAEVGSTVVDVARAVIGKVAPAELGEFDFVARRYAEHPSAARRAGRPSSETTASVLDYGGQVLGAIAIGITTDMCKDMIKAGARNAHDSGRRRLRTLLGREPEVKLSDEVPPIGDEHVATLRSRAVAAVLGAGGDAVIAEAVGAALVNAWPRRPA